MNILINVIFFLAIWLLSLPITANVFLGEKVFGVNFFAAVEMKPELIVKLLALPFRISVILVCLQIAILIVFYLFKEKISDN